MGVFQRFLNKVQVNVNTFPYCSCILYTLFYLRCFLFTLYPGALSMEDFPILLSSDLAFHCVDVTVVYLTSSL